MRTATATCVVALGLSVMVATPALAQLSTLPTTTRKVVLEKTETGYRWKLIEAAIPALGDHQVLVHVRAVALNRGDLEMLEPDRGGDRSGLVVASDAAGDRDQQFGRQVAPREGNRRRGRDQLPDLTGLERSSA